jgi:hypothetical protein
VSSLSRSIALAAACAAAAFAPTSAWASDAQGNFTLRGYGSRSCGTYLTEMSDPGHANNYASWLMGYATARNRLQSETFDILPFPEGTVLFDAVSAVCRDQQAITVEAAANEVIRAIAPLHQRSASAVVTIDRGEQSVRIRQAALAALQARLAELGLYSGPADGEWREELTASLTEFQLREKIVASGLPDLPTLIRALVL